MTNYQSLLQATVAFNRDVNLTRKIFKSRKKSMLSLLPIIYRKPKQLNSPLRVLVQPAVPMESRSLCLVGSSTSRSPNLSKMPVTTPLKSGRVTKSHAHTWKVLPKSKRPMRTRRGPSQRNQTLCTPLAETKENFETLLSLIGTADIKED